MRRRREWLILCTLGIGSVMGTMNNTVVVTTLPVIRDSFGADLSSIEWVLMSYLLTISMLLTTFGRLGDIWGHKRVYLVGLMVFIIASALCSISPSLWFLIISRALQAVGGAMLIANSSAIVSRYFLPERRGQMLSLLYTIASLGTLIGPSLGGFLATAFEWRSIFYANVLLGIVGAAVSLRVLPDTRPGGKRESFDILGAGVLGIGLGALLLAVSKGQDLGWTSPPIISSIVVSMLFLMIFFRLERSLEHPMIDITLFRNRVFSLAMSSAFVSYICIFAGLFLTPFFLMQGRGFSPAVAGQIYSAQPIGMLVSTPLSGYLSDRIGARIPSTFGALAIAAGLFMFHNLGAQSSEWEALIALAVLGIGNGFFIGPNASTIMGSAPPERQGVASAVVATARNLGMVFGIASAGAILAWQVAVRSAVQPDTQASFIGAFQDTLLVMMFVALIGAMTSIAGSPARSRALATHRAPKA